jgi:hypothetical protein
MIEMRWIVVPAGSGRGLIGGSDGQMHESVLQYRYRVPAYTQSIDAYPPRDWEWSEWQDVPTVADSNGVS